jgi:hypothetical protein
VPGWSSVNQAFVWCLFQRGCQRPKFRAIGAANRGDPAQMVLRLIAVTLFDLPRAVI